jgi:exo-1,4-beta-D-glucosaminidase
MPLRQGWAIQSACKINAEGPQLSSSHYRTEGWTQAIVPTTVLAAQVAAGVYPDPYYGMNMRKMPGADYPIGKVFSNLEMPAGSPYRCGWWYRKQFQVPAGARGRRTWLHFGGINYRADIWVNGQQIANSKQIAGAYRIYNLDITKAVTPGKPAVVAVETFAPGPLDLGINWVDWNPSPPDKDMGVWGPVALKITGPVAVRYPFIATHFEDAGLQSADITVTAELENATSQPVQGTLSGTFMGKKFHQPVDLAAHESKSVSFSPEQFPQLKLEHPPLWWPIEMGAHPLEKLTVSFTSKGNLSDTASARVGIREMSSELTDKGARLFRVNGKSVLIRGGGWSQDLMMREDHENLPQQIRMVKDMHLNAIRQEAKLEGEEFYRLTDENGILVLAGWCCCDQWEHWNNWTPENHEVASASLRSQMLRLRHHASLLVWLNGSDNPPPTPVEQAYLSVEKDTHWPNPTLSSATGRPTSVSGASGVKMTGPYNYVSPSYWEVDTKHGGAWAFNTETSPGPAIPQPDSLRKFIPAKDLWPIDQVWGYHAGGGDFMNVDVFNDAMRATYGMPDSMPAYSRVAQTMAYDGERAMFEAYARNKYTSTGVIQWMLNNAWPSVIWHLYDYYLNTGGGYFGTKKACEPLHVQYSYDDHSIYVVNSVYTAVPGLTVSASVYDVKLHELFHKTTQMDSASDSSTKAMDIPEDVFQSGSPVYFVRLELKKASGEVLSHNFYWVPEKLTEFDWAKTKYTYTPAKTYEDMTALNSLPPARVEATMIVKGGTLHLRLKNSSKELAFQLSAQARDARGEKITPQMWSSNYIELMPGEERELNAEFPEHLKNQNNLSVTVSGWNVKTVTATTISQKAMAER